MISSGQIFRHAILYSKNSYFNKTNEMLCSWQQAAAMLEAGEISKEDYDKWRYHYPEFDKSQKIAEVMSQELSDIFKDINDSDRR